MNTKKNKTATPETKKTKVYQHPNVIRCTARIAKQNRPRFLKVPCNTLMKAVGTRDGGRVKRWQCPECGSRRITEGQKI